MSITPFKKPLKGVIKSWMMDLLDVRNAEDVFI